MYFTNNGDTVRGHNVQFSCSDVGYWLHTLIDHCNSNGRVLGKCTDSSWVAEGCINMDCIN